MPLNVSRGEEGLLCHQSSLFFVCDSFDSLLRSMAFPCSALAQAHSFVIRSNTDLTCTHSPIVIMIWLVATAAAPAFCFNLFLLPSSPISPRLNHHSLAIWGPIDSKTTRFSSIRLRACLRDDGDRIMSTPDQTSVAPRSCVPVGRDYEYETSQSAVARC